MKKYRCKICGYIYDETKEKVKFNDLPDDWTCPLCGAPKSMFEEVIEESNQKEEVPKEEREEILEDLEEVSNYEKVLICSNLAKACEKEYKEEEKEIFLKLANYFYTKEKEEEGNLAQYASQVQKDLELMKKADEIATKENDRGAKRVLNWASKSTQMVEVVLKTYQEKGLEYIKNVKIWVCDICGFIYIGDVPPKVCPICKVPSLKILEVK